MPALLLILITLLYVTPAQAHSDPDKQPGANIQAGNFFPMVKFETSMGEITIELYRNRAPETVNSFLNYVARGEYDNTLFHRIIPDYIVQGGGYDLEYQEKKAKRTLYNESGNGLKNDLYSIAMARKDDPHSATRQFFFNLKDNDNLNPGRTWGYTVFGSVIAGTEVLDAMSQVETEYKPLIRFQNAPKENVVLIKATVVPEP